MLQVLHGLGPSKVLGVIPEALTPREVSGVSTMTAPWRRA